MTKTIEELTAPITGWWITHDEETYHSGPIATREDAVTTAEEQHASAIIYGSRFPVRISDLFSAGDFLDRAEDDNEEWHGDNAFPLLRFTSEQLSDLQASVCKAMDEWQVRHQLAIVPWCFDYVREVESVEASMPGTSARCP